MHKALAHFIRIHSRLDGLSETQTKPIDLLLLDLRIEPALCFWAETLSEAKSDLARGACIIGLISLRTLTFASEILSQHGFDKLRFVEAVRQQDGLREMAVVAGFRGKITFNSIYDRGLVRCRSEQGPDYLLIEQALSIHTKHLSHVAVDRDLSRIAPADLRIEHRQRPE